MRIQWDASQRRLRLDFDSEESLSEFHLGTRKEGGLMVPLGLELDLFSEVNVELSLHGGERLEFAAEVAQAFGHQTQDGREKHWDTAFVAPSIPELSSAPTDLPDETEAHGTAPVFRIQKMNPNQKARLAGRAGRQERQVLLRDSSPTVLQGLLANPRLEAREVLRLVKSTHATAGLLKRIAEDGRWGKNLEILASVAKNPKTPPPLAVRLMDRLRTSDLRLMGKMSSGLREDVRRAALREYLKRSRF